MCSHYHAVHTPERLALLLGLPPGALGTLPLVEPDLWPRRPGLFLREAMTEATEPSGAHAPSWDVACGRWGLLPPGLSGERLAQAERLSTFNARTESAATKDTFRRAWARRQRCVIAAEAIYEPDWRSGRAVPMRIQRADGLPLAIAGLWDRYRSPEGEWIESYTMLTVPAATHPLFRELHRPDEEKRRVAILPETALWEWLHAPLHQTRGRLLATDVSGLVATPEGEAPRQGALF